MSFSASVRPGARARAPAPRFETLVVADRGNTAGQAAGIRQVEKEISELHGLIMKKLDEMP